MLPGLACLRRCCQYASFAQYLTGIRRFCETTGLLPLPPTPTQSPLLQDALRASKRFESEHPVRDAWVRAGISASQTLTVVRSAKQTARQRNALWVVAFCFAFRGGIQYTVGALCPKDFEFYSNTEMSVCLEVLKRTGTDCTSDPRRRMYSVPDDTDPSDNPVLLVRRYVAEFVRGSDAGSFLFSQTKAQPGTVVFVSDEIRQMAAEVNIREPKGMRFSSHSPRRGMLTELVLHNPRPASAVVKARMDWAVDNSVVYFCRDVFRSVASVWMIPGTLQDQVDPGGARGGRL